MGEHGICRADSKRAQMVGNWRRCLFEHHLQPLDDMETRAYVEHRMTRAGWKNDPSFDDEVFDGIYRFTHGVPRRINTLCDRLLLYCYLEEHHRVDINSLGAVTRDIVDEHGMPDLPQASAPSHDDLPFVPDETQAVDATAATATESEAAVDDEQRLALMESRMATMNVAMQQEIQRLRSTLAARQDENTGTSPEDDDTDD